MSGSVELSRTKPGNVNLNGTSLSKGNINLGCLKYNIKVNNPNVPSQVEIILIFAKNFKPGRFVYYFETQGEFFRNSSRMTSSILKS